MTTVKLHVGVIGDPVAHSISPAMHQLALDQLGINAIYHRWHTPLAELPDRINSLRKSNVLGANVTVPHKQAVIPLLDELSEDARRAGAVNTISNRIGRLYGDNTDIAGLVQSLKLHADDLPVREAILLGAGGAARAVVLALASLDVDQISVINRTRRRAVELAETMTPIPITTLAAQTEESAMALRRAGLVVNSTTIGWQGTETPLSPAEIELVPPGAIVLDLTYRDTELLRLARGRGLMAIDGLEMLVFQGAKSLEIWTGMTAPVEIMMRAAVEARAAQA